MAVVLQEQKYNQVKDLLKQGYKLNEIASKEFVSQTTISRVKKTKNYEAYLDEFTAKKSNGKTAKKSTTKKVTEPKSRTTKRTNTTVTVKHAEKESVFKKMKNWFKK